MPSDDLPPVTTFPRWLSLALSSPLVPQRRDSVPFVGLISQHFSYRVGTLMTRQVKLGTGAGFFLTGVFPRIDIIESGIFLHEDAGLCFALARCKPGMRRRPVKTRA